MFKMRFSRNLQFRFQAKQSTNWQSESGLPNLQEIVNSIFEGPKKFKENRNPNVTITPEDNISLNDTIKDIPEITFNKDIIDDSNVANENVKDDHANKIENSIDEAKWIKTSQTMFKMMFSRTSQFSRLNLEKNLQMWNMWYGFSTYLSSDNSLQSTELFEANIEEDSND